MTTTHRIYVEKYPKFQVEANSLKNEFNTYLSTNLRSLRLINVYDLFGFSEELLNKCKYSVFAEIVSDSLSTELNLQDKKYLAVEYIPGQFDQRASSAVDCVHLIDPEAEVQIRSSKLLIFDDDLSNEDLEKIKHYYINTIESRPKDLSQFEELKLQDISLDQFKAIILDGFTTMTKDQYKVFCKEWGLAMNEADLDEVVKYFKEEKRDPTETELRILDTYWSDHCRHTTFTTEFTDIKVDKSFISEEIEAQLRQFFEIRSKLGREDKSLCLMELATIGARHLQINDLEISEENNACSIIRNIDVDGKEEPWLIQFKNETHNHPTEIEPFGGASTCLGGAIRDPLSGRSYVYQAMRVTGASDINAPIEDTLPGKLPQRVISKKAAAGYSSYGNQIGLATTCVREIFHPGYTAKRLEVGAVVGAVKAENVRRESPTEGDIILLLGGPTGRDGIGGATGSSKEHSESSIETCGSEVQKGNAPEERKLQRLFRRPEFTKLIKKSNDFGAGGVSVAIGELAEGLDIYLDAIPKKYIGLNPTELAISESQERMAIVIEAQDRLTVEEIAKSENVEVTYVADVTNTKRMRMYYDAEIVANLSREFIDSAGAKHYAKSCISEVKNINPFEQKFSGDTLKERILNLISSPNIASQKGLVEMFDSSIGRSTVLMPYGGCMQATETQVSVQKLPVQGYTDTATMMAFGFNPDLSSWSPYHGAAYAVVEACTKLVAAGADYKDMRFSYQEYFERMTSDPHTWGKPTAALLGALKMQIELNLPSIGGKDSMSGSFENIKVPPTLIAFGINTVKASRVISPEFEWEGNHLYLIKHHHLSNYMPNTEELKSNWDYILSQKDNIVSGWACSFGGVAEGLIKMSFGNQFGANINIDEDELFNLNYGSIIVESINELDYPNAIYLGKVTEDEIVINGVKIDIDTLQEANEKTYKDIYPLTCEPSNTKITQFPQANKRKYAKKSPVKYEKPLVFIPVFPGTNCDYDTARAYQKAGAEVRFGVFRNLSPEDVLDSIAEMKNNINECQILTLVGGFSAGDEPDGSGKYIANVLNNKDITEAINKLLERGGLILGICNGFQALVKSGLLPYGKLGSVSIDSPTLFRNDINRHISCMATTRVASTYSPWLAGMQVGDLHTIPFSHGEGKFVVSPEMAAELFTNGQVAFQYADPLSEEPTMTSPHNPNGSAYAIEGIIDPSGQILGKMGHSERYDKDLFKNINEELYQPLFENAVRYFK